MCTFHAKLRDHDEIHQGPSSLNVIYFTYPQTQEYFGTLTLF